MYIRRLSIALSLGILLIASFSLPAQAKIYVATYTGTVATDYFGDPADDTYGVFGGGLLTGDSFTAQFSADFNPSTLVTNTGTAIAVGGT